MPQLGVVVLNHELGDVHIQELSNDRREIRITSQDQATFLDRDNFITSYPLPLIETILTSEGPTYLCDEIAREEDPLYGQLNIELGVFSYVARESFRNRKILDFGCGAGASTTILAKALPQSSIVGVELVEKRLTVARARARHFGLENAEFYCSPSGGCLPPSIGEFDFIVMNAVYEHLLPTERRSILPLLWSALRSGGVLFVFETPYRWYPVEVHSTGLVGINYLPASLARALAHSTRRERASKSWEMMLRRGIRGGSRSEIQRILRVDKKASPALLEPRFPHPRDAIDIWYARSLERSGSSPLKSLARLLMKALYRAAGIAMVPELNLALAKRPE